MPKYFTLIEVLFAVIILALALGITLAISANAKGELIRARQRWIIHHALEQAAEYCLLANPDKLDVPNDLLPDGFRAQCRLDYTDTGASLPDFAAEVEQHNGWKLGEYTISLYDPSGEFVDEMVIQKLVPAEQK